MTDEEWGWIETMASDGPGGPGKSTLKDRVRPPVRVLFVGINPGIRSAAVGHHFAGYSNRFWTLLFESGLVPEPIRTEDDDRLSEWGYGLTNLIPRATPGIDTLRPAEYAAAVVHADRRLFFAELIGQREQQRFERLLVIRFALERVQADALSFARLVEQFRLGKRPGHSLWREGFQPPPAHVAHVFPASAHW